MLWWRRLFRPVFCSQLRHNDPRAHQLSVGGPLSETLLLLLLSSVRTQEKGIVRSPLQWAVGSSLEGVYKRSRRERGRIRAIGLSCIRLSPLLARSHFRTHKHAYNYCLINSHRVCMCVCTSVFDSVSEKRQDQLFWVFVFRRISLYAQLWRVFLCVCVYCANLTFQRHGERMNE